jgi:heat shock protein HtpX
VFNQAIIDFATGSRPVSRAEQPDTYNLLENLCISRGLKMPTLRLIETDGMNAFASGLHEGRFSITVTRGLLQALDRGELEAVLGHELTHIINRDVRTMVVAAIFAGVITLFCQIVYRSIVWGGVWGGGGRDRRGNLGLFLIIAMVVGAVGYFLAIVIRMAISRTREYVADAGSVELTHNPDAMISALQKVAGHTTSTRLNRCDRCFWKMTTRASWASSPPTRRWKSASPPWPNTPVAARPRRSPRRLRRQ